MCDRNDNLDVYHAMRAIVPILPGNPPEPCPELLTEAEAIRYLRLDQDGPKEPVLTLRYYREKGRLHGTRVGPRLRYRRAELDRFLERQTGNGERDV